MDSLSIPYAFMISIHSPHARGDRSCNVLGSLYQISIHSPHARGDLTKRDLDCFRDISIHSPHARGDAGRGGALDLADVDFNPLPSCEGRL